MTAGVAWLPASLAGRLSALKLRALPDLTVPGGPKLWVDPIGGNDGNSGQTTAAALKTFARAHALAPVSSGVSIILAGGAYHEHGAFQNKSNLLIQPAPGEQPWFEGYVTLRTAGWTYDAAEQLWWHPWTIRMDRDDPDNYAGRNGTQKNTAPVPDLCFYDGRPLDHVRHWDPNTGTLGMTGTAATELTRRQKLDLMGPG
ncbi:MAG: hypothetical protein M3524_08845, partial [Actinomycetota bacterium]|nr:hypothetical protein [Actinomycetota bacterium]